MQNTFSIIVAFSIFLAFLLPFLTISITWMHTAHWIWVLVICIVKFKIAHTQTTNSWKKRSEKRESWTIFVFTSKFMHNCVILSTDNYEIGFENNWTLFEKYSESKQLKPIKKQRVGKSEEMNGTNRIVIAFQRVKVTFVDMCIETHELPLYASRL